MNKKHKSYLKTYLFVIFLTFLIIFITSLRIGKIQEVHVKEPNDIIIDDNLNLEDKPTFNEEDNHFIVESENEVWHEMTSLNIFNNEKFMEQKIIAPGSKGTYEFKVKNKFNNPISYIIGFGEDYSFFVNMKYRLKKDGNYILGNKNKWLSASELYLVENEMAASSVNTYILEWYWDSNERDNIAGINGGYYTLKLYVKTT